MQQVEYLYLTQDILSSVNRKVYGIKGDKVEIISDHDNCYCVKNNNISFGINKAFLSSEKIEKDIIIIPKKK